MTVRAIWTGLIRFASMLEVVIERCMRRIEALPENELRARLVWIAQFFSYHKRKQEPYTLSNC